MRMSAYNRYCQADPTSCPTPGLGISEHPLAVNVWINATNLQVKLHLRNLYAHLLENHYVVPVVGYDSSLMEIFSRDILSRIQTGKPRWGENGARKGRGDYQGAAPVQLQKAERSSASALITPSMLRPGR